MKKLVKYNKYFYVIDQHEEIKEGDFFLDDSYKLGILNIGVLQHSGVEYDNGSIIQSVIGTTASKLTCNKITHSTQEGIGKFINPSTIEELVYGYSWIKGWEKLNIELQNTGGVNPYAYEKGFKAHQRLTNDRLFTADDMRKAILFGADNCHHGLSHDTQRRNDKIYEYIKSVMPKNEWLIDINDENNSINLITLDAECNQFK